MQPKLLFLLTLVTAISFTACKKGDAGVDGINGTNGKDGENGKDGTANVIYSEWIDSNPWVASTTSTGVGKKTYYFDITEPKVTQAIIDSGTVMVYAKFVADPDKEPTEGNIVKVLPSIYYNIGSADTQYRFQYGLFTGKIRVICDIVPSGIPSTANKLRYVIIPGGKSAALGVVNEMNYTEVCSKYNIAL